MTAPAAHTDAQVRPLHSRRQRRLRISALMIAAGLLIEFITLRWAHPTAFIVFALGSGSLIGIGALLFLTTLLLTGPDQAS